MKNKWKSYCRIFIISVSLNDVLCYFSFPLIDLFPTETHIVHFVITVKIMKQLKM